MQNYIVKLENNLKSIKTGKKAMYLKRKLPSWVWAVLRLFFLAGISFVVLYPLIFSVSVAFRTVEDIGDPSIIWIPKHLTLENINLAIKYMDYWTALWNTIKIDVVSSVLQVVSCALVGYGFARFNYKGKGLCFALAIFTIIIPPQVVYIPNMLFYRDFDFFGIGKLIGLFTGEPLTVSLLDTSFVMYLPAALGVGIRSGLFIYIFRQFYRNLPKELEDAAQIDGCGYFSTFVRLIVPNAKPAIITVFLFSMVWYWSDYYYAMMYFNSMKTVTVSLEQLMSSMAGTLDYATFSNPYYQSLVQQSAVLLSILPLLIIYILFQRHFVEGVERSGIVG